MMRVGMGYDVHQLVTGRKLVLGGVTIPFSKGLKGHSDADVMLHAACDALLGAAGLDDIGIFFPNTDKRYKDISSLKLLAEVAQKLSCAGCRVVNIDIMLLAEEPEIRPFTGRMKKNIADVLHIKQDCISVKATTNEGLGFVGQKKGMAAYAVCLLERKSVIIKE